MSRQRFFVSGGAGVIGRHLVHLLCERGASVFVGDLKPRPGVFPPQVQYRQGDLNTLTASELRLFAPDTVIHLAATFERSIETYGFWEENFWHNVRLSHHLMTLAKDLVSLKRVVFASSYLIYDRAQYEFTTPQEVPTCLTESATIAPRNLTGMAKLAHEVELRFIEGFRGDQVTTVCARIFRGYGMNSRDVASRWIRSLLANEAITVFRPQGMFDFIYAKDTAEGLIRLADDENVTGAVNLGTGQARKVQDLIDVLQVHFPHMTVVDEDQPIPFEASQADISLLQSTVNWHPSYTLELAIPEMIAFERDKLGVVQKPSTPGHVLVTSASSRKAPLVRAVMAAARKLHPDILVFAGDCNENSLSRYVADEFWQMPPTTVTEIGGLIDGCKERGIRTIIPTRDGELPFWAEQQARFLEEGIAVAVASATAVSICLDKLAFARFGADAGLPVIPTGLSPEEVGPGPYVVKERYGAGSRLIGLNLKRKVALKHARSMQEPVYQPYVAGREISIDAWMDREHRVKGLVLRTRDQVVDGESQVTTTFMDCSIEAIARRVLEALQLRGPIVMQALVDSNQRVHVIECNSRVGGASTTAIAAGLDMLYWSLLEASGADTSKISFQRDPGEVRQVRLQADIIIHDPDI